MNIQLVYKILGILFSLVGSALVLTALLIKKKNKPFYENALQAEGTIIDLSVRTPRPFKIKPYSEPAYSQVTIEFVTNNDQIIQSDIDTNLTIFYTGQYKKGDKVKLLYNPEKPTEFVVNTSQSTTMARLLFVFVGLFLLLTGISMVLLINYLFFHN